jgi:hypothetical protein
MYDTYACLLWLWILFIRLSLVLVLHVLQRSRGAEDDRSCNVSKETGGRILPENWRVSPGQTSVQYDRPLSASAPHVSNPFPRASPYCKLLMGKIVGQAPVVICGSEQIESHEH